MNIGKSTKVALAQVGKGPSWLADQLGVSRQTASVLANRRHATCAKIEQMAKLFNLTVIEFIALGED